MIHFYYMLSFYNNTSLVNSYLYNHLQNYKLQDRKNVFYFIFQTRSGALVQRWRRATRCWAYDRGGQGTNHHHTKQDRQRHISLWGQQPPGDQQCWIYTVCVRWVMVCHGWWALLLLYVYFTNTAWKTKNKSGAWKSRKLKINVTTS